MEIVHNTPQILMTVSEVAQLLRTTSIAIYTMYARGQIEGAVRIRSRLLFKKDELLRWIDNCAVNQKGNSNER